MTESIRTAHKDDIEQILRALYPKHCNLIGPTNVSMVADGAPLTVLTPPEGQFLDLREIIAFLASVAGLIADSIAVLYKFRGEVAITSSDRRADVRRFSQEVNNLNVIIQLPPEKIGEISELVIRLKLKT